MIRCERATIERSGRVVVEALSITLEAGEATALVGPTGAGKSSWLAAMATAVPLHAGSMFVEGHCVRREAEAVRRAVGYVPDRLPSWPGLRAREFLELFAAVLPATARAGAVSRALDLAGLSADPAMPIEHLAAGQRKRLLLARALLHDPSVLLLDDPWGGLDPAERAGVERLISDTHLMGRTVVAAIDDAVVPTCFTRLVVLSEGRLVTAGAAVPSAHAEGRAWRHLAICRGSAETAAMVLAAHGAEARAIDADAVMVRPGPRLVDGAEAIAAAIHGVGPLPAHLIRRVR